jgi:hypothetical protein
VFNHEKRRTPMLRALRVLALVSAICLAGRASEPPAARVADVVDAPAWGRATPPQRLLISGHSLTDRPFPDYLAAIAGAAGMPIDWNMQHLDGSSLRTRTRGHGTNAWAGYSNGIDRDGRPVDVLRELAAAAGKPPYDVLILTEQHTLLENLIWNDTIGNALDYEARFSAANPDGQTYLFAAWLHLDDLDDPLRWIAYERAAAWAWRCTTLQINRRLAARGSRRHVVLIPAAEGLAALVEHALGKDGVAGITADTPGGTIASLFADDVHLTKTGNYFVALLTHVVLYGALPRKAWAPDLDPVAAEALQDFAVAFLARWRLDQSFAQIDCTDYLSEQFVGIYLSYMRDTRWRNEGWLWAYLKWARFSIEWQGCSVLSIEA